MQRRSGKSTVLYLLSVAIAAWIGALAAAGGWIGEVQIPIQGATLGVNILVGGVILFIISLAM
jgi:hypothetical protein